MGHQSRPTGPLKYWAEARCSSSHGLYLNGGFDPQAGCLMQLSPLYARAPHAA